MTKDELLEFLAACGIDDEQVSIACEFFGAHPECFVWEDENMNNSIDDEEAFLKSDEEDLRREISHHVPLGVSTATSEAREALLTHTTLLYNVDRDDIYSSLTRDVLITGGLLCECLFAWRDLCPTNLELKTQIHMAILPIINHRVYLERVGSKPMNPEKFWIGCTTYVEQMMGLKAKSYWEVEGFKTPLEYWKQEKINKPEMAGFLDREIISIQEMKCALDALDNKFDALKEERDQLERRVNRNREIAVAIRKLQTMNDKDFRFRYKYQWIGVYEVMCDQHLLPDGEKSTFCRLCNSPDNREYFLPEDEAQLPNPYVPGESGDKESTWHQLSSHGDTPKQQRVIEKTKKEFLNLLREQGII